MDEAQREYRDNISKWIHKTIKKHEGNNSGFTPQNLTDAFMAASDKLDIYYDTHGFSSMQEAAGACAFGIATIKLMINKLVSDGPSGLKESYYRQLQINAQDPALSSASDQMNVSFDALTAALELDKPASRPCRTHPRIASGGADIARGER